MMQRSHKKLSPTWISAAAAMSLLAFACSKKPSPIPSPIKEGANVSRQDSAPVGTTGAPGTLGVAPGAPETSGHLAPAAPAPVERGTCVYRSFQHKPLASHQDGEACLHHKNELSFDLTPGGPVVNPKSVCVRVNGVPVAFQFVGPKNQPRGVVVGAVAGPKAEVSFRYCTMKESCADPCKVPRDEFLSAIGGAGEDNPVSVSARKSKRGRKPAAAGWGGADEGYGAAHAEAEKELAALDQDTRGAAGGMTVFKDWVQQARSEGCAKQKGK